MKHTIGPVQVAWVGCEPLLRMANGLQGHGVNELCVG
jgi:hypothetical protein